MTKLRRILVVPVPLLALFDIFTWEGAKSSFTVLLVLVLAVSVGLHLEAERYVRAWSEKPPVRPLQAARYSLILLLSAGAVTTIALLHVWSATLVWGLIVFTGIGAALARTTFDKTLTAATIALAALASVGLWHDVGVFLSMAALTGCAASFAIGTIIRNNAAKLAHTRELIAEQERTRMSADLHDFVAHEVTGIAVLAQAAATNVTDFDTKYALEKIESAARRALAEIRSLVEADDTRSTLIADDPIASFEDVVRHYFHTTDATIQVSLPNNVPPPHHAALMHRTLTEALTNIRRHALPEDVFINLADDDSHWRLEVVNDGVESGGIGTGAGSGLERLRESAKLVGGSLVSEPYGDNQWQLLLLIPKDSR